MNTEVSVGDGLGGQVVITEVNPFTVVDADDDAVSACGEVVSSRVAHVPVIVEVSIDYEEVTSLSSSDEDFLGFREDEVEDARDELNSSIRREVIRNQSLAQMISKISCGATKISGTSCRNDGISSNAVQDPKNAGKDCEMPMKVVVKQERCSKTPEKAEGFRDGVLKVSVQGNGDCETFGSCIRGHVLQGNVKRERTSSDKLNGSVIKNEYSSKRCREQKRTSLSAHSAVDDGSRKSCEKINGDSKFCECSEIGGSSVGRAGSCQNPASIGDCGGSEGGNLVLGRGVKLCLVKNEPCEGLRDSLFEFDAGGGDSVSGLHGKRDDFVSKNKRKNCNVRKHPLYAKDDSLSVAAVADMPQNYSVKRKKVSKDGGASQSIVGKTGAGPDTKRSSRVRKLPAKLRDGVVSNVSWIKTEPSSDVTEMETSDSADRADVESLVGSAAPQEKQNGTGGAESFESRAAEVSHIKVNGTFSLADSPHHSVVASPIKRERQRKTESQSYSDSEDSDYVPNSPEKERESSYKRNSKARGKNLSKLSHLAEYTAPDGENGQDVGYSRHKAWSCKLCSYKSSSESVLEKHLKAHTSGDFKCRECPYLAISKANLEIHIRKHTGEKPYKCTSCEYSCTTNGALKTHIKAHIGYKPFSCSQCDQTCLTKSHLVTHMRTHTGEKPFCCSLCSYKTANSGHLTRHMGTHTGEKPFRCKVCKFSTSRSYALQRHVKVHEGGKVHRCTECEFSADFALILKRHMFEHAVDEFSYKCPHCDFKTALPASLRDHVRTHRAQKPKSFICTLCHYSNIDLHHMRQHMRSHADDKPFKCTECSYSSSISCNVTRHLESHSGKRPYSCDACPKKYWDKYQLKYHKKTCKGSKGDKDDDVPKRYRCSKCDFTAQYCTQLNIHKKTHTDDAAFHCNDCDYVTNSKAHLTMHMRKHSEEMPYKCAVCGFGTTNTIVLKRHQTGHKELWPFSCAECNERFRLKIHLDYHEEKGCEAAALPLNSKEPDVGGSSSENEIDAPGSPQKTFKKKAVVRKIVRRKTAKRKRI